MPKIIIVAYKLRQEAKPSKRRSESKNRQATYLKAMTTQVGKHINQIYENLSKVTIPISKPQTVYTTLFMATQANRYVGWPPLIPLNVKGRGLGQ